jgi:NADPH2:quinone reductase
MLVGRRGTVGFYAAQLARLGGARSLIATVSSSAKAEVAAAAGVPVIVNYRSENVAERVMQATEKRRRPHLEVDFGGNLATTLAVMSQDW